MEWKGMTPRYYGFGGDLRAVPSDAPPKAFVFRGWRNVICCAAAQEFVLMTFGDIENLQRGFGGYMTFGRVFSSHEFLGVWGHRNASRFRRLLRERLGALQIVHAPPPARHAGSNMGKGTRPTPAERDQFERQLKAAWPAKG